MATKVEKAAIRAVAVHGTVNLARVIEEVFPGAVARYRARSIKERDAARFSGNPPTWAMRMVRRWETSRNAVTLKWRRSKYRGGSGRCGWDGRIVLTAGADEMTNRCVLIHELAHHRDWDMAHGDSFYDALYEIAKGEGLVNGLKVHYAGGHGVRRAARRARAAA